MPAAVIEPRKYSRALVTGASGFVGTHLVPALGSILSEGADLFLVAREQGPQSGLAGTRSIVCDLDDRSSLQSLVGDFRPDLILHMAAQSSVGSIGSNAETYRTNVCGTLNLAEAVETHCQDATLLFTSSAEVYGGAFNDGIATEDTLPQPLSPYARSKLAAEFALNDILSPSSARLIIVRPSNHSGAGQDTRFVIPAFAQQLAGIERGDIPPSLSVGNLEPERDFLDVSDVVAAYIGLLSAPELGHRLFNVASGRSIRIADILARLIIMSTPAEIVQDAARMRRSDVPRAALTNERLRNAIGWEPRSDIDTMLNRILSDQRQIARGKLE